ncbi:MAG: YfiR/HmsC family protein [Vicingaceae bacterium]
MPSNEHFSSTKQRVSFLKAFLILLFIIFNTLVNAQPVNTVARVKAGFIGNFYHYVDWPEGAVKDTFRLAILQEEDLAETMTAISARHHYGDEKLPIKVSLIQNLDKATSFNMVYANNNSGYKPERLFNAIGDSPTLLITENYDFKTTMINFITVDSRIKFQVNILKIESRNIVVDNTIIQNSNNDVNQEEWQKLLKNLRSELNSQAEDNENLSKQIAALNAEIEEKTKRVEEKDKELYDIQENIMVQKMKADQLEDRLKLNEEIIEQKQASIVRSDKKLKSQIAELEKAKEEYAEVQKNMSETKESLDIQKKFTIAAAIIALLIAILLFYSYKSFVKQKKLGAIINKQKEETEAQRDAIQKQHVQLEEKTKEITDSINYAKRIQEAILPPISFVKENLPNSFIFYQPKDIVAGDFYWMEAEDDYSVFAAADCTGHGVPGAMVSVICSNALNRSVREFKLTKPGKVLDKTLEIVLEKFEKSEEEVKDGMDIAICTFEKQTGKLLYAGANNPLWIVRKNSNEIEEYKADKQPIGSYLKHVPFNTHETILKEGDTAYIFSDGYSDQFGGKIGKKFKSVNFKQLLIAIHEKPMHEQRELIEKNFYDWMGNYEQLDDVCVIGFRA